MRTHGKGAGEDAALDSRRTGAGDGNRTPRWRLCRCGPRPDAGVCGIGAGDGNRTPRRRLCRCGPRPDAGVCGTGAGDGNRTRTTSLGSWSSAIELRPQCAAEGAELRSYRTRAPTAFGRVDAVLLSDRDILAELEQRRVVLEPYDPGLLQPSSFDVRLDRL